MFPKQRFWAFLGLFMVCLLRGEIAITEGFLAAQSGSLSKNEILAIVESCCSRIKDFSVSYDADAVKAPKTPGFLGARIHHSIVVKGDKAYIDRQYGAARELNPRTFRREVAFNGRRSTLHMMNLGRAMVMTSREDETKLQGTHYFDLMLLNPVRPDGYGRVDQNLVSLLKYRGTKVRRELENVQDRWCYALDVQHPQTGKLWMEVWLDAERGFLPLRQLYYKGQEDGESPFMEFTVDEAIELADGLWFATSGFKRVSRGPAGGEWVYIHHIEVDEEARGQLEIALNKGVEDAFFDLWKRLPVGTDVWDRDLDVSWTVGGDAYEELGEAIEVSVDGMHLPVPERRSKQRGSGGAASDQTTAQGAAGSQTTRPGPYRRWLAIAGALMVVAVVALLVVRRTKRSV